MAAVTLRGSRTMRSVACSLALLAACTVAAHAQVLFSNFGPGFTYSGDGNPVNGTSCSAPFAIAAQFQPSASASFQDAKLALFLTRGTNQLSVYLETDAGGQPGTILEGPINVTGLVALPGSVVTANSSLHPFLVSGTSYWLVVVAQNADTCGGWFENSTGDQGNVAQNADASPNPPWSTVFGVRPAFQIDGVPTDAFQAHYVSNLTSATSYIDIVNTGSSTTSTGGFITGGNLCVQVYAFDPSEELLDCCTCTVTPNELGSIVVNDSPTGLYGNTLTNTTETAGVVKLVATSGTTCSAATEGTLAPGLAAWATTPHQLIANGASAPFPLQLIETPFTQSALSAGEYAHLTTFCAFILADGSKSGVCGGCTTDVGLGATSAK
jgi:hypothetical protein